ncbi:hypothetical protein ACI77F_01185 [Pseudomonas tritici]|uniref:hypothetical protein n=1 Tax=Pseudomonas tritici TaxID=2745518 RepID=UPI00387AE971
MQSVSPRITYAGLLFALAITSTMSNAATFAQPGTSFTTTGSIATAVKLLAWTPVPCSMALSGQVSADGSSATITGATFTPANGTNVLCTLSGPLNLPWTLVPTSANTATLSGFSEKAAYDSCAAPSVLSMQWSAADNRFSIVSPHTMTATCRITAFSFTPSPVLTINP